MVRFAPMTASLDRVAASLECRTLPARQNASRAPRCPLSARGPLLGKSHTFISSLHANRKLRNAPPYLSFRSCPKRKTAPRPGLRAAAACGRRRRHGISAAAPLAGRREAGPGRAIAARWWKKEKGASKWYTVLRLPSAVARCSLAAAARSDS